MLEWNQKKRKKLGDLVVVVWTRPKALYQAKEVEPNRRYCSRRVGLVKGQNKREEEKEEEDTIRQ
ncbi:hypothetical protein RRF57_012188 [Xylaria bambusicola]|uniref:Uncharacterized protein n=1 Tax=Xylaria bambusicola TaxID=326684 RepID=A0AAN7V0B9_9PEZI